jgi:hypothetical protein
VGKAVENSTGNSPKTPAQNMEKASQSKKLDENSQLYSDNSNDDLNEISHENSEKNQENFNKPSQTNSNEISRENSNRYSINNNSLPSDYNEPSLLADPDNYDPFYEISQNGDIADIAPSIENQEILENMFEGRMWTEDEIVSLCGITAMSRGAMCKWAEQEIERQKKIKENDKNTPLVRKQFNSISTGNIIQESEKTQAKTTRSMIKPSMVKSSQSPTTTRDSPKTSSTTASTTKNLSKTPSTTVSTTDQTKTSSATPKKSSLPTSTTSNIPPVQKSLSTSTCTTAHVIVKKELENETTPPPALTEVK